MFAHVTRTPGIPGCAFLFRILLAAAALAALPGCAAPPALIAGAHPADPNVPVRPTAYRSTPHTSQRPVEPSGWSGQNERVAPEQKQ